MSGQFQVVETTVDEIHGAMEDGEITSQELVKRYLERIDAYDRDGPELNSIVTINEDAVDRAAELDETLETDVSSALETTPFVLIAAPSSERDCNWSLLTFRSAV